MSWMLRTVYRKALADLHNPDARCEADGECAKALHKCVTGATPSSRLMDTVLCPVCDEVARAAQTLTLAYREPGS